MAEAPDEAKELRLVNNVELKIALADTDGKLQRLLNLYLAPLILKLNSPHATVRNKVIAMCQHISTRIKPATSVLLPVAALLAQFKDPLAGGASQLIRSFDLMYIKPGLARISVAERLDLLPALVADIAVVSNEHHQRSLLNIVLQLLPHFTPPPRGSTEDAALRAKLGFAERPEDARWLADWFRKLMLLRLDVAAVAADSTHTSCPGLAAADVDFLTLGRKKETFAPASGLAEIKAAVLRFVASGAFTAREAYFVALVASTDTNAAVVADVAEDVWKRCDVSVEDEDVVRGLYEMLLGAAGVPAVKPTLQAKIVGLLAKSRTAVAAAREPQIDRIVELGLDAASHARLKQAVFGFVTWTARLAGDELTHALAPGIVEKLRYWLLANADSTAELKGYAYETMALLAGRDLPLVVEPKLDLVRFLFARLDDDKGGVAGSIEGALGILLARIAKEPLAAGVRESLEEMLLGIVTQESRGTGQAVKWAGRLLGFGNVVGRWIGALAVAMGGTVAEEGAKALHPYYYRLINPEAALPPLETDRETMEVDGDSSAEQKYAYPEFAPLVHYLFEAGHTLPDSLRAGPLVGGSLPAKTFAAALAFTHHIAIHQALQASASLDIAADEDWERTLDVAVSSDESARALVEAFFVANTQQVQLLLDSAWHAMTFEREGVDGVQQLWNELAELAPDHLVGRYVTQLDAVRSQLTAPKAKARAAAARAVGLLGSHPALAEPALATLAEGLAADASGSKSGAVSALGFLLSRLQLRSRLSAHLDSALVQSGVRAIETVLTSSRDATVVEAAIEALGELCVFGVVTPATVDAPALQSALLEKAKRGDERAVRALGQLACLHAADSDPAAALLSELTKLSDTGTVERSFVVGEALACAVAGWSSSAIRRTRSLAGITYAGTARTGTAALLSQLLARAAEPGGGGKRRTTVVALLSLFELCAADAAVRARLQDAQAAFRAFLTDRDDFIQESAARGLTAVYGLSDDATRTQLVRQLVASFTGEAAAQQKLTVSHDTQLFAPGQLPTGDGASVGSYGDIMSLAAELGDPSLVYKFMTLARHNSVWASRAAFGRFGLGTMLRGSDEVKSNARLWPVLYRYRFDPSAGVRRSMDVIWSALGGGHETVERWFDGILDECMRGAVNGKEWRVREASIAALADLLAGRRVSSYAPQLEAVWRTAFRVLDDVKESVRTAAMKLCRVLAAAMVRAVEAPAGTSDTTAAQKQQLLETLMTFLLGRSGLEAEAKEVQLFALTTLLQVIKASGPGSDVLHPWIPSLLEKLLLLLSDLEPEAVNYLVMNASKYNTTGDDIDRVRLHSIRSSPIMSAIEELLDGINPPAMALVIPALIRCIRISLGLPSKVACSRVVVSLVMRRPTVFKPYADEVLKPLLNAVMDRSETVGRTYASAVGYLCRIASDAGILKAVEWAQANYWGGEERERRAAGTIVAAVWKHATDRANALAADLLPFIFLAKSDIDATVAEEFAHTWTENTGGSGAVKLYLSEIVALATQHLASPRWSAKQTCAYALAEAAEAIAADITSMQLDLLWTAMVTAMGGKSWQGKEKVLAAFVHLGTKGNARTCLSKDQKKVAELEKICLREAKRNNATYRGPALGSLGKFLEEFAEVKLFEEVYEIVDAAIGEKEDEDGMDIDSNSADGRSAKQIQQVMLINGLTALAQAFRAPSKTDESKSALSAYTRILDKLAAHNTGGNLELKDCHINVLCIIVKSLSTATTSPPPPTSFEAALDQTWTRILEHLRDRNYERGRIRVAKDVLENFGKAVSGKLAERVSGDMQTTLAEEKSPMVLQVLKPAAETLKRG